MSKVIDELTTALGAASDALASLQQEQAMIPARLQAAAGTGDAAALLEARQRASELPDLIFAAQVGALRCELALVETELSDVRGPLSKASAAVKEALERVGEAQQNLLLKQRDVGRLESLSARKRDQARAIRSEIDKLVSQAATPGKAPARNFA